MTFSSGWMATVRVPLGDYCTSLVFSAPWIQQIRRSVLVGFTRLMWSSGQVNTNVKDPVAGVNLSVLGTAERATTDGGANRHTTANCE